MLSKILDKVVKMFLPHLQTQPKCYVTSRFTNSLTFKCPAITIYKCNIKMNITHTLLSNIQNNLWNLPEGKIIDV